MNVSSSLESRGSDFAHQALCTSSAVNESRKVREKINSREKKRLTTRESCLLLQWLEPVLQRYPRRWDRGLKRSRKIQLRQRRRQVEEDLGELTKVRDGYFVY